MIYQAIRPETIFKKQRRLGVPSRTVCVSLGISDTLWCLFLAGKKGLSYAMQPDVFHLFELLEELAQNLVPVDFRQAERIRELWKQRKSKLAQDEARRLAREMENRTEHQERSGAGGGG
jgi:hypothetical protein